MKLTKGKLSKIRNKKNQSAKRFKKTGKGRKTKTFRNKKALNLHNTSLKKYKGGKKAKSPENDPKVVEPTKPEEPLTVAPTSDVVDKSLAKPVADNTTTNVVGEPKTTEHPTTNVVVEPHEEVSPTSNVVGEPKTTEHPTSDVVVEPHEEVAPTSNVVGEPQTEPVKTDLGDPSEGPGSHQELPAHVSEVGSDSDEVSPEAKEEMVENEPVVSDNVSDAGSEVASEDAAFVTEEEPVPVEETPVEEDQPQAKQNSLTNDVSIVAESLDKLAEYISDKIAKKLNLGSGNSSADLNRDSFNAFANANDALVQS